VYLQLGKNSLFSSFYEKSAPSSGADEPVCPVARQHPWSESGSGRRTAGIAVIDLKEEKKEKTPGSHTE